MFTPDHWFRSTELIWLGTWAPVDHEDHERRLSSMVLDKILRDSGSLWSFSTELYLRLSFD